MVWDVVELDLSFQMRIVSPSDSPGLRFSGGVLDFGVQRLVDHLHEGGQWSRSGTQTSRPIEAPSKRQTIQKQI